MENLIPLARLIELCIYITHIELEGNKIRDFGNLVKESDFMNHIYWAKHVTHT